MWSMSAMGYISLQVEALKQALLNKEEVINCSHCDFRGAVDLVGLDLHGIYAPGINFQPCIVTDENKDNTLMECVENQVANLSKVNFANATLFSSCFNFANLEQADFSGADITKSSFIRVNLKNAKLFGALTQDSTFCDAVMPDGKVCKKSWTSQGMTIECNCEK
jgi:uncharacterized protein YjbI with pentapeptide repeats